MPSFCWIIWPRRFALLYFKPPPILSFISYRIYSIRSAAHIQSPYADQSASESAEFLSLVGALKNKLQPDILVHAIDSASDLSIALNLFRWASRQKDFYQTADTYAHIIFKLALSGNLHVMDILLKEMGSLDLPNVEQAFSFLVCSFCKNEMLDKALQVFEYSTYAKCRLPLPSCNALLSSLVIHNGTLHSVLYVYKEMVKAGICPNLETLNYLMKALCEAELLALAMKQFSRMDKKNCAPNSQTFEILISSLCSNGRVDEAVKLLNLMLEQCCSPSVEFYDRIIPLFCQANRFQESIKLFKLMKDAGFQLDLYDVLIQCLCKNQQISIAVELFEEMIDSGFLPTNSIYVNIVDGYCKMEKLDEAASFLDCNRISETEPYNTLLEGYIDSGMHGQAITCFKKMIGRGLTDSLSWNIVIRDFCQEGYVRRAFEVIGKMITSSHMPEECTYASLIIGYCRQSEYDNALDIFRLLHLYDLSFELECSSQFINDLCSASRIQEAIEVFYYIIHKGSLLTSDSLDILVRVICKSGNLHEAIRINSLAVRSGISCLPSSYSTIFSVLLGFGNKRSISTFLSHMVVGCQAFDATTYCILVHGLCVVGMSTEAALAFNQMIDANFRPDAETLEVLLIKLVEVHMLHTVAHSLHKLIQDDNFLSPRLCNMVISGLLKEGYKLEASTYLDKMLEIGWIPNSEAHCLLVGNPNLENNNGETLPKDACDYKISNILAEGLFSEGL